jgi:hypothetical protein
MGYCPSEILIDFSAKEELDISLDISRVGLILMGVRVKESVGQSVRPMGRALLKYSATLGTFSATMIGSGFRESASADPIRPHILHLLIHGPGNVGERDQSY